MDEQISQFVSITGADPDKAKFYVDSAAGDVQEAVMTYFESEGAQGEGAHAAETSNDPDSTVAATAAPSGPRTLSGAPAPPMPEGWGSAAQGGSAGRAGGSTAKSKSSAKSSGRMTSLADLGGGDNSEDDDEHSHDDDDDPVNFFAGGERSALSVQNPNHGRRGANSAPGVVRDILQRAREMTERRAQGGAHADDDDDDEDWGEGGPKAGGRGAAKPGASTFGGQGRTLADSGGDDDAAGEAPGSSGSGGRGGTLPGGFQLAGEGGIGAENANEVIDRRIIFWQDGFSLEDGPLCRYDDPQHAQTLAMINQGAAPLSFLNVRFGQRVNLNVEQRQEKFKAPPTPPMKPFAGHGNRLGSPAPGLAATASSSSAPATTNAAETATPPAPAVPANFKVDNDLPTTQLQIRLADGQRMVGRFNHSHTVADIRNLINAAHPGMSSRAFVLQASFPPKPFEDETQTLKDAGLINAVVIQKWT